MRYLRLSKILWESVTKPGAIKEISTRVFLTMWIVATILAIIMVCIGFKAVYSIVTIGFAMESVLRIILATAIGYIAISTANVAGILAGGGMG